MLEACLRTLFTTRDLSAVKDYCTRQWAKILSNRVSVQVWQSCVCVCFSVINVG
jgi:hypothetical protein